MSEFRGELNCEMNAERFPASPPPTTPDTAIKSQPPFGICAICESSIVDPTLLSANGASFHLCCLRCAGCESSLESSHSCYFRDGAPFCKTCYARRFGAKCSSCDRSIQSTDWVRRARSFVYHLACFICDQCHRQLSTGEEFALTNNRILCKQHFMELIDGDSGNGQPKQKTKRVRTTFAEEQLSVLQTHFQIDSNPDGADLERIANMTGLSKRVTQVWFQNSRARQKKYQGNKKARSQGSASKGSRSSEERSSPCKSPHGSEDDGMLFPTSVTTSAEEAMLPDSSLGLGLHTLQYDAL
ncbi:unnamed protein product, partial [Mesorhabditis belari]|uniref:LIM/homeobox protein Awh n=1 Tax=Mesorhabditis belari TaxID=2138241 RepID=A0AAF3FL26_9BILA